MIPDVKLLLEEITETTYPTRTYKLNFRTDSKTNSPITTVGDSALSISSTNALTGFTLDENGVVSISYNAKAAGYELTQDGRGIVSLTMKFNTNELDRISGYIDDLDALIQAIYLILMTERYQFIIYSWDYGVELLDLFGKPMPYVMAELPRRITDALTQDDRIEDVINFEFERYGKQLRTSFTVVSNVGNITTELEVVV